ncbi:hypothetical protein DF947_17905 [Pedobacter paludis]|uniref:Uncharacterized protein n=1 Tax=Pedobacter paludis TaxID=2203212 RepID=A0A317EYI0_9SPHI|nr:hypothetical protein DF947_17905 [Pedobacter paludis]
MFKIVPVWCLFRGSAIRLEILRKLRMTRGIVRLAHVHPRNDGAYYCIKIPSQAEDDRSWLVFIVGGKKDV